MGMRIGLLADAYKPHISGITNFMALNKQVMEKLGHEVFIFTFGEMDYIDDEVNVIRSPGLPLIDTGYYLNFSYSREARKLLHTMDIVHVQHPFLSGSMALRYCRPRGIPIIFTNHTRYDLYAQAYLPVIADFVGETMIQAFLPSFCRACDLVVTPSLGMRQVLISLGVDVPIEVIPNGVDLTPFQKITEPVKRTEFGFKSDDVVLIYAGRLGPEKNLPYLLRAFAGVVEAFDHVNLLIVGDGPERDNLQDQVKHLGIGSRVHFTGMVPYEDIPRYLMAGDAFVTASVSEVHPLSVIEAMAASLPVLGITSPGVGDIVRDGDTGLLSSEDVAAFTAKMVKIVTEHDRRAQMSVNARKAAEVYDIQRTTRNLLDCYSRVIDQSASRKCGVRIKIARFFDKWRS